MQDYRLLGLEFRALLLFNLAFVGHFFESIPDTLSDEADGGSSFQAIQSNRGRIVKMSFIDQKSGISGLTDEQIAVMRPISVNGFFVRGRKGIGAFEGGVLADVVADGLEQSILHRPLFVGGQSVGNG